MYINKVWLYGNLTRDPELKALPSGSQVVSFGLATNRTYKDKDGAKKEQTEFHNIVAFGKTAEVLNQWLKKGSPAFIEGRIQTRSWDDQATGKKAYRTEVIVDNFQFGPKSTGGNGPVASSAPAPQEAPTDAIPDIAYPTDTSNSEDIPF
jgi:single-strand DNA-binding protein